MKMALTPEVKKEIIAKYGSSATDTGSPEAQVALLSRRIEDITSRSISLIHTPQVNFGLSDEKVISRESNREAS